MNRNCHRIVFNKRRGQFMAVAETSSTGGKSAAGESTGVGSTKCDEAYPGRCRSVVVAMWVAFGALPMSWAQIIADPTAPANQRPTVLSDSTGRPLVNIQTPSSAGLSRNTYQQFDVPTSGIVLDNSTKNPWLSNGVLAKTILNEVNSSSQSFINGAITVNGAKAQVIVANPNGITINGGSFVNATRATLTTGTAQVTNGVLTGFNIGGGVVTIGTAGFNNSATPYTDIMSRAVSLTGKLMANEMGITAGLQTVAYDTGLVSDQNTSIHAQGTLSIDTAALGGMYADNISILSTEAGLGVRNLGTWQATGGQIVVTADGQLQNQGTVAADVISLATVKDNVENAGSLQGKKAVVVSSGADVRLYGSGLAQTAGSTVLISAKGSVRLDTTRGATIVTSMSSGGQVSISAGQDIQIGGAVVGAKNDVQLISDGVVVADAASVTSSGGNVSILAGAGINLSRSIVTGKQVHLETGAAFKDTAASLVINGGNVRGKDQTTLIATDSILISSPGGTAVGGDDNVHIQAAKEVNISAGSTVAAGQHMSIMAGTNVNLQTISGDASTASKKVTLTAGDNMLVSGNTVNATGATISAGKDLSIEANDGNVILHALLNAGGTRAENVALKAGNDLNVSAFKGSLYATGLQATAKNINLMSNGTTSVTNATINNGSNTQAIASTLTAKEDLTVGSISTTAGDGVTVKASNLKAGGQARVLSNGGVLITASTDTVNDVNSPVRSSISAGSVAIQGGSVKTEAADIKTTGKSTAAKSGDIAISATQGDAVFDTYLGIANQFKSTGNTALHANGNLTHRYTQADAVGSLSNTSATGQINSTETKLVAKDVLSFGSKGAQTHTNGDYTGGSVSVFNETGHLALHSVDVKAVGTKTKGMEAVSGQLSIESGGTLGLDAISALKGATDLSITQGQGDIILNSSRHSRGTLELSQIEVGRNLTLAARNGNLNLMGLDLAGYYNSKLKFELQVAGDLDLVGNSINLYSSSIKVTGALNLTSTTGNVDVRPMKLIHSDGDVSWYTPELLGSTGVNVLAAGNINMASVRVTSDANVKIMSGGNTTIGGKYQNSTHNNVTLWGRGDKLKDYYDYLEETWLVRSNITGKTGVSIGALGGNLTLDAIRIEAANGMASLQALGDINIEAAQYHILGSSVSSSQSSSWFGLKKSTTTSSYHEEQLKNQLSSIRAQDIEVKAGNNLNTYGTRFYASRNLNLQAGDAINYYAVYDQLEVNESTSKQSSFIGIKYNNSSFTNSTAKLTGQPTQLQSLNDVLSNSGGNQLLQGTKVSYGSTAAFNAGVGEKARAEARIILEGMKNTVNQTHTKESNYVVWQKMVNQGSNVETLDLPSFTGPSKPVFNAPGGISAQIPDGDFKTQITTLSQQPGMAYLADLTQRSDVNWQPVKLAYESWNYKQEGLTPAGAALLGLAVAWAMPAGVGANLVGVKTGTTALVADAAFTSLASTAAITFVNNKGDVGKTLKELASSQTVKATIAAALTAGVIDKLGATGTMKDLSGKTGLSEKLTYNLINASGRALTNTAINGGNLEDALKAALVGGLVDTLHGQAASQIKGLEADYLAHKLAHALAGCVAGAAASGTCKDGAIGGAVGEIVVGMLADQRPSPTATQEQINAYAQKVLAYGKLVAGTVSAFAGGDAQTSITTAETAIKNNGLLEYYFPRNLPRKNFSGRDEKNNAVDKLATIDSERQRITLIQPSERDLYAAGTGGDNVDGYTVIFAHAAQGSIQGVRPENTTEWNAFVNMIRDSGAWKEGQPIILDACNTGLVDNGVASALAKSLKTKVIGASSYTWNIPSYSTSGFSGTYNKKTIDLIVKKLEIPDLNAQGVWKTFSSDGKIISISDKNPY